MAPVRLAIALVAFAGCVHQDQPVGTYFSEPAIVAGPPGGGMDPSWNAGYPGADASNPAAYGDLVASADPADPGYVMGAVTDAEIDTTLEGYGEWVQIDGYGDVWRPYATEVGLDFTPYESCGSWVWTDDWGWVYGCDWDWGWLPFHYGQWGWFDDYWAWVPDYEWSPAWVEWRGGGGYVGWRPQAPVVRDHRHHHQGPTVRDHRTHHGMDSVARVASLKDSQWRFASAVDFGKRNIRAHLFKNPAEGLAVTQVATRPPLRGSVQPVKAASIMQDRLAFMHGGNARSRGFGSARPAVMEGAYVSGMQHGRVTDAPMQHTPSYGAEESDDGQGVFAPGAAGTEGSPVRGQGTSGAAVDGVYEGGMRSGGPGNEIDPATPATPQPDPSTWDPVQPQQPTWSPTQHPSNTWQPAQPERPTWTPTSHPSSDSWQPAQPAQPTWTPTAHPSNTWQPAQPQRPTWSPPVHAPSSSWQPAQPSRSWSPPSSGSSHSSGSSWSPSSSSSSSSHSWSPSSHSSGGGGGWSAPSHSSPPSSSGGSHSGGFGGGGGRRH